MANKKKIAIIFGGRSSEHEVSIRSAKNVTAALNKDLFEPILVGISKKGTWFYFESATIFEKITALIDNQLPSDAKPVALISQNAIPSLIFLGENRNIPVDCAFPILHGTFGEDGCIQGLFKMANLPFVGCGVFGSAAGMDKEVMKRLLKEASIPSAKYKLLTPYFENSFEKLTSELGLPFFIKPASQGSSVGVHKIKNKEDFNIKLADAFKYDTKVLAEEFIQGREIECSVMGTNHAPQASVPGEIIPTHEFYSYEAKYLDDNGAALKIPAELDSTTTKKIQDLAKETFHVMGCEGLTRVDFFLKKNGELLINEINTIPGFTKISMYPKMWEASGVSYSELITKLIQNGLDRFESENRLSTNFL